MRRLPVVQSFKEVFSGVTRHYFELIGVAPVGVALILLGYVAMFLLSPTAETAQSAAASFEQTPWSLIVIVFLLFMIGFPAAAVRWHRFVLIGERPSHPVASFWGLNQTRYFLNMFKLMILMGVLFAATAFAVFGAGAGLATAFGGIEGMSAGGKLGFFILALIAVLALYLAFIYLVARLSISFPAAAVGQDGSFREAMENTKGNEWRLLGYTLLVQFTVVLAVMIFGAIVGGVGGIVIGSIAQPADVPRLLKYLNILLLPATLYQLMIGVTMLSVAYREIVGLPPQMFPNTGAGEDVPEFDKSDAAMG
jgi:hypothetical protein